MTNDQLGWTIDVCATCGRLATWPGCEHWQSRAGWCIPIQVRATPMSEKRLLAAMREQHDVRVGD